MDNNYIYNKNIEEVYQMFNSSSEGLKNENVVLNKKKYGENILKEKKKKNKAQVFLEQYKNLLVILLMIAALISIFTGGLENTIVILFVITLNAVIGTIQYSKAEKSINSLKRLTKTHQRVIRNGVEEEILEEDVVVGDILIFNNGDIITADCRLIEVCELEVDESSLTGESEGIVKNVNVILEDCDIQNRKNIVHRGSKVINGNAKGICYAVGMDTEIGKIAALIDNQEDEKSPLEKSVDNFSRHLSLMIVIICTIVFIFGIYNSVTIIDSLMFAIALAVAAIPEALFTILTIVLAVGTEKMAKENAIVKDIKVVETLGCVNVVATDKTGTITENKMAVNSVFKDLKECNIDRKNNTDLLNLCLTLCNESNFIDIDEGKIKTDAAILSYLLLNKIDVIDIREKYKKVYEIPFSSKYKYMMTGNIVNGKKFLFCKGAPETIINKCSKISISDIEEKLNIEYKSKLNEMINILSKKGLRVIACCYKDITVLGNIDKCYDSNFTFLGLVSLSDPPKKGVKEAIEECISLKVRPVMITGDYEETAKAIGKMVGINSDYIIRGNELFERDVDFNNVNIFSRVSPKDKIDIVSSLQNNGNIVAFIGDGVNDAPAIKKADVGISMGKGGTDVSKEASSIILVDDNYQTIVNSIKRGRGIFDNIQNVILYLLSGNIAGLFMVLYTLFFNLPVPFVPLHLLFINLINDSLPAIAIGVDDNIGEENSNPRNAKLKILNKKSCFKILLQGILIFIGTLISFMIGLKRNLYVARTMAFLTICIARLFHSFNCRGNYSIFKTHKFNKVIYISLFIGLFLISMFMYIPSLSNVFFISKLTEYEILVVYFWALFPTIVIQIWLIIKDFYRRLRRRIR